MKFTIELYDEIYDYLKQRAKKMNEEMGAEIITAEDVAAGILIARRDRDQEEKEEIK